MTTTEPDPIPLLGSP